MYALLKRGCFVCHSEACGCWWPQSSVFCMCLSAGVFNKEHFSQWSHVLSVSYSTQMLQVLQDSHNLSSFWSKTCLWCQTLGAFIFCFLSLFWKIIFCCSFSTLTTESVWGSTLLYLPVFCTQNQCFNRSFWKKSN